MRDGLDRRDRTGVCLSLFLHLAGDDRDATQRGDLADRKMRTRRPISELLISTFAAD